MTETARLMTEDEITSIDRRLASRDPSLDLHRAVPELIATLRYHAGQVKGAQEQAATAKAAAAEADGRLNMLQLELARRKVVIEETRKFLAALGFSMVPLTDALVAYDRGDIVFGGG